MKGELLVTARVKSLPKSTIAIPEPAFAEIAYGIERLPTSRRKSWLWQRYEMVRAQLALAPWTQSVTEEFGRIKATLERKGLRIEDFDAAIAAHATAQDATLVSGNKRDMARIPGVKLEDWSSEA